MVDLAETVRLNHERNIDFDLKSRPSTGEETQITQH
jgi:hypothetical protein